VEVDLGASVGALKGLLVEKSEIPADQQRLIYKGRVLKDDNLLNSYGRERKGREEGMEWDGMRRGEMGGAWFGLVVSLVWGWDPFFSMWQEGGVHNLCVSGWELN
jgi:hypothetical protein